MLEDRNVKLDLFALALLALAVFAGLSLATYHRADPIGVDQGSTLVYPGNEQVQNICGRGGAWVADRLLRAFGIGAYYLLLSVVALDVMLLLRRPVPQPTLRCFGWLVSFAGLTTLAAMALPAIWPSLWAGPEIGPGGLLGAAGRGLLEMNFAAAGAYVLTLSLILGGLLLSTDYLVVRAGALCFGKPLKTVAKVGLSVAARRRAGAGGTIPLAATDDEDGDDEVEQSEVSVRILGRRTEAAAPPAATNAAIQAVAEDDEEEAEDDEAEDEADDDSADDDAEAAAAAPKPGMGQRIAAALRIRAGNRKSQHAAVIEELEAAAETAELPEYQLPDMNLLLPPEQLEFAEQEKEVRRRAKILEKTFANFGFNIKVVEIETGPVIAQFEVELEAGLRLSKITGLADDLAIALRVPSVRIVAPIPGKNTVGIEVPNTQRQLVRLREVMEEDTPKVRKMKIPIFLGKDVSGNPLSVDLSTLPHLLIAGRTGTGKSVCLNTIIVSMIMTRRPDEVRMLMIDPKMVELSPYKNLPHLMHPVVTDMRKAEAILAWAVEKMEERYALLARAGVRHVSIYNQLGEEELMERIQPESEEERKSIPLHLPYIVCIADEIADLMMTAPKEVEGHIIRLAQKSRAVGIHLVLATQKPTVDVITGLIKSNLPARICFQVASRTDSRVVLDEMGADKLLGNGDLLFLWPGTSTLLRGQGTYLSDDEITRVIGAVATSEPQFVRELVQLKPEGAAGDEPGTNRFKSRDDLYEAAIDIVVREGRGSVSLLQRALGIGYGRGARLIDFMAEDGIVGAYNGSQAREVLISPEQWATMQGEAAAPAAVVASPPPRRNRIEVVPRRAEPLDEDFDDEPATERSAATLREDRAEWSDDHSPIKPRPSVTDFADDDDELDDEADDDEWSDEDVDNADEEDVDDEDEDEDEDEEEEEVEEEDESLYGVRRPALGDDDSLRKPRPSAADDSADDDFDAEENAEADGEEEADESAEEEEFAELDDESDAPRPNSPPPRAGRITKAPKKSGRQARSA